MSSCDAIKQNRYDTKSSWQFRIVVAVIAHRDAMCGNLQSKICNRKWYEIRRSSECMRARDPWYRSGRTPTGVVPRSRERRFRVKPEQQARVVPWWRRISEDWWAVICGATLIALVMLGVIAGVPW